VRKSRKTTVRRMTFAQVEANFFRDNGYYPPRNLRDMPLNPSEWHIAVQSVKQEDLR